ncbi:MAG: hypothetical protein ABSG51_05480 [Terracidiphilus sp.]|jgi:hypothetical protein
MDFVFARFMAVHLLSVAEVQTALPRLSIPERFRPGIAALADLSQDSFDALIVAIEGNLSADTADLLASELAGRLRSIPQSELAQIVSAIVSLQSLDSRSHVPSSVLASDVWDGLSLDSPKLAENIDGDTLKSRVLKVVDAKSIHITSAKIHELQTEVERSFCTARILTDVRAAFSDDASELPTGMTVLHTLQIGYHDDTGRHREFYVTLESDDLEGLRDAIDRAEMKKKALEELLAKADCRLFE